MQPHPYTIDSCEEVAPSWPPPPPDPSFPPRPNAENSTPEMGGYAIWIKDEEVAAVWSHEARCFTRKKTYMA